MLSYARWVPPTARAALVIAHGLGEHGGRYAHVALALAAQGYDVWAIDHRGHGASGGARGLIMQPDDPVVDLHTLMERDPRVAARINDVMEKRVGAEAVAAKSDLVTEELK